VKSYNAQTKPEVWMPTSVEPQALPLPKRPIEYVARPIRRFLEIEFASGIILAICTLSALILANSSYAHAFHHFWDDTFAVVGLGPYQLNRPLHFWVNDALMTLFFFVVGLEIKRELVAGELSSPRKAMLPAAAALGGMVIPACVYLMLNPGGAASRGWGIPMGKSPRTKWRSATSGGIRRRFGVI
jgi:NhaA family Na+:H+ antiporter